jgi:hypothetical protein
VNTLKSAALVAVLLAVLYGVFVALSKPDRSPLAPSAAQHDDDFAPPLIDYSQREQAPAQSARPPSALPPDREDQSAANPAGPAARGMARSGAFEPDYGVAPALSPSTASPPVEPTADAYSPYANQRSSYEYQPAHAPPETTPLPVSTGSGNEALPGPYETDWERGSSEAPRAEASPTLAAWSLHRDLQQAEQLVDGHKFRDALALLSPYHSQPQLGSEERALLAAWLDALAAKVIYSREHLLAMPHKVRNSETMFDIAGQHQVGWQLLQNVNGLSGGDPRVLVPGTELKIVRGPFRADVSLASGELTLYVGDLYAGRFPFVLGNEPPPPGTYKVVDKREDRTYIGLDGRITPANDPANPYGGRWISLGGEVSIHGSPLSPSSQTLGCISLSPRDARDVYGILTVGSEVTVRR